MRRSLVVLALTAAAVVGAPAPAPASDWDDLATRVAAHWSGRADQNGSFNRGDRYADAMMGYALLDHGLATGDDRAVQAGLSAVSFATRNPETATVGPSVFEQFAVAAAYNRAAEALGGDPRWLARRDGWAQWLRRVPPMWMGIDRFYNKQLVEAARDVELLRSGLDSPVPGAVLSNPPALRSRLLGYLRRLPKRRATTRFRAPGGLAVSLSDAGTNPLAYHALSAAFLARTLERLGPAAPGAAWTALRRGLRASAALAAPDGDIAYAGRSQEQAWALAFTASAAVRAARWSEGGDRARARALAHRALARLRREYVVDGAGIAMTPALKRDGDAALAGLDHYYGPVSYPGLTLAGLNWARASPGAADRGRLPADRNGTTVLPWERGRLAAVRRGGLWYAVTPCAPARPPTDLRQDFGLAALQVRGPRGALRDLLPRRPRTALADVDSAAPSVMVGGKRGWACGRLSTASRGRVVVKGGFLMPNGRLARRGTRFTFAPADGGVVLSFRVPARREVRFSHFFAGQPVALPRAAGDGRVTVVASRPVTVATSGGWASASHAKLVRADFTLRAGASGRIRITVRRARP
jgi:hypothetical protein